MKRNEANLEDPFPRRDVSLFQIAPAPGEMGLQSLSELNHGMIWGYYVLDPTFDPQPGHQYLHWKTSTRGEFLWMENQNPITSGIILAARINDRWFGLGVIAIQIDPV